MKGQGNNVECVWFDEEHNRQKDIFDQRSLYKAAEDHGLYKNES